MGIPTFIKRENNKEGNGMGIVVGSGMLMASMDLLPEVYRFIEYKDISVAELRKVILFGHYADFIVVNAWFSVSNPESLFYILSHFSEQKIIYYSNVEMKGHKCQSLHELANEVKKASQALKISF